MEVYLLVIYKGKRKTFYIKVLNNSLKILHTNITLTDKQKTKQNKQRNQISFDNNNKNLIKRYSLTRTKQIYDKNHINTFQQTEP